MTSFLKKSLFLFAFCAYAVSMQAQNDSLAVDSIMTRIKEILRAYEERVIFIDTSDYESYGSDAKDVNLQIAASKGYCMEIARLIVEGADPDNYAGGNARPIHYAISSSKKDAVELLLLLGASPDSYDLYGNTPLIAAVKGDNLEISEILIRSGCDMSKSDHRGSTALHHAAALGFFYLADMLLYYGATPEIADNEGNTPLMVAVWARQYDISDILLREGANPGCSDLKGYTPLMLAAQEGDTLMMKLLINAGANIYSRNPDGYDALSLAVRNNRKEAVRLLLEIGNRWNYPENSSVNPASVALSYGHRNLIPVLKEKGISYPGQVSENELTLSAGGMLTNHFALLSGRIVLRGPFYGTGLICGADFTPTDIRMMVKSTDDVIRQYTLKTTFVYAGLTKKFTLDSDLAGGLFIATTSLSAGYKIFSHYSGTLQKPEDRICIMPSAGLEWGKKNFGVSIDMIYLKTPFYKMFPVWLRTGLSYTWSRKNTETSGKKIRLYYYE